MKKIFALLLIAVMCFALVACGNSSNNNDVVEYEWEQLEWPVYDNAKQIPIPNTTTADVRNKNDRRYDFYVPNFTIDDYKAYVEECKEKGFTIDAIEQQNRYFAFNEGKYELTVQHLEGDIMYVQVVEDRWEIEIKLLHTNKSSADMYDIRVEIDKGYEESGDKGQEAITFESQLKEGTHTLLIENDDDDNINGRIDFTVTKDGEYFEFEITCMSNRIDIKPYSASNKNESSTTVVDEESTDETNIADNTDTTEEKEESTTTNEDVTDEDNTKLEDSFNPYGYAITICQIIKDALYNPESIQINKVYYLDAAWHQYYIDVSAMNKMGGYTRNTYVALFNDDSSLYSFDEVYSLPDLFEKYDYLELDTDYIEESLN